MGTRRLVGVLLGLALTGALLGALAGVVTVAALVFAVGVRQGHAALALSPLDALLGALIGGACGAGLAPVVAFTPWRYVPVGRLFAHLTIGTAIGGSVAALLFPTGLSFELIGGLLGFLVAGDRLASTARAAAAAAAGHEEADAAAG